MVGLGWVWFCGSNGQRDSERSHEQHRRPFCSVASGSSNRPAGRFCKLDPNMPFTSAWTFRSIVQFPGDRLTLTIKARIPLSCA